ncbi:unnamed protein product [Rotaria socialis]|uniref:HAT C-terminal dimerisation domain-containing protein n=1 Tax=Rotaria socialis TaxID=392032 RepID=A0A820N148_9BILA|nr:unnamed protein product [Rotaria socialis]CAF4494024.1 unnamed protein product [Rotaria socialis]
MSGKCSGVQTILRQNHMPNGIHIHCHAHRLNLVIVDVNKVIQYISEFYQIVSKIHSYFVSSSVTNEYYQTAQQKLAINTSSKLKPRSDIRWDSRCKSFLNYDLLLPLAKHIDCDQSHLFNEIQVLKQMLENKKLSSIAELYQHMKPLEQAFPRIMSMVQAALTIPVSSSTCERVFSKMNLIKTRIRNSMADERLGDLCILSIERDYEINFEQVNDQFSVVHKNSRIMLC